MGEKTNNFGTHLSGDEEKNNQAPPAKFTPKSEESFRSLEMAIEKYRDNCRANGELGKKHSLGNS